MQDTEQLKMILEVIGKTTDSAKWVLLAWMALDFIKLAICWIGAGAILAIILRTLSRLYAGHSLSHQCRDLVYPGERGTQITARESSGVVQVLRLGLEVKNERSKS